MKLLVVKTSSMGDVIHTFPALTDALRARPDLVVDWCVESPFAGLVRLHPGVRNVHEVAVRRWRKAPLARPTRAAFAAYRRAVRAEKYDLVIDAQGLLKSAVLARQAGAPVAGLDRASAREWTAPPFYAQRHAVARDLHAIDRTRILFGRCLGYEPDLGAIDYGLEPPRSSEEAPGAFLLHGTTWPSKRWHVDGWVELAAALSGRGIVPAMTWADDEERAVAERVAAAVPAMRLVEKTDLARLAVLLAGSRMAVGTDTGLTHLACALRLPTVEIALSTAPGLTGPRGDRVGVVAATIACAPCRRRDCPLVPRGAVQPCAPTVSAEEILQRLDALAS